MTTRTAQSAAVLQALLTAIREPRPAPHPHHQALLDAHAHQLELDAAVDAWGALPLPETDAESGERLDELSTLLVERAYVGREVARRLGSDACCPPCTDDPGMPPTAGPHAAESAAPTAAVTQEASPCILAACLDVFACHGSPDAMSSAELVAGLRTVPGTAEGRWPYAHLTQPRLAALLRPYEVASRNITHADGRRRKSYRRSALLNAVPFDCDC
ncbi:DUF3631 domain-containing protein [Streptomyces lavendulae]|uniref:DUF3631 domain-containing protein n=1 Tax=Streptomyces lavendulae TaxID=1914 RepID=UPI00340FABBC